MIVERIIRIEAQRLMGDEYTTYFVDAVEKTSDGKISSANLRSTTDVHLARQIARDVARMVPTSVQDETMLARDFEQPKVSA